MTPEDRATLHAAKMVRQRLRKEDAPRRNAVKRAIPKRPQPRVTEKADRGRVRDPLYLVWIRRQPCAFAHLGPCDGPVEACHVRFLSKPGLSVKPNDRDSVPGCGGHHRTGPLAQHKFGERRWWETIARRDPKSIIADLISAYESDPK